MRKNASGRRRHSLLPSWLPATGRPSGVANRVCLRFHPRASPVILLLSPVFVLGQWQPLVEKNCPASSSFRFLT